MSVSVDLSYVQTMSTFLPALFILVTYLKTRDKNDLIQGMLGMQVEATIHVAISVFHCSSHTVSMLEWGGDKCNQAIRGKAGSRTLLIYFILIVL